MHVYDVSTNEIYETDPTTAELLRFWDGENDEFVVHELSRRFPAEPVEDHLKAIKAARADERAFLPNRTDSLRFCQSCFDPNRYDNEIGQLTLSITDQCNLRCRYCPYTAEAPGHRPHGASTMDRATAFKAIDYYLARSSKSKQQVISLYGGEPLLAMDLIKACVAHVRASSGNSDVRFIIDTNAVLIDDDVADYLVKERIGLQISLDGPQEIHDRYRVTAGGSPSHDMVVAGIERLLDRDTAAIERMSFSATVAPPSRIPEVVEYFQELPFLARRGITAKPVVGLTLATLTGAEDIPQWSDPGHLDILNEQIEEMRQKYVDELRELGRDYCNPSLSSMFDSQIVAFHRRARNPLGPSSSPGGFCAPGLEKLHVLTDGHLQPCERVASGMVLGHIDTGIEMNSVASLMKRIEAQNVERCRDCWAIRMCDLCFTSLERNGQRADDMDATMNAQACRSVRRKLEQTFKTVIDLAAEGGRASEYFDDIHTASCS